MDAVKFLKEWKRMCDLSEDDCRNCSMGKKGNNGICINVMRYEPEEAVAIVEKWSTDHPAKTNQSEFLKLHPNADIREGILNLCPRRIDLDSVTEDECVDLLCSNCKKQYWLSKVE